MKTRLNTLLGILCLIMTALPSWAQTTDNSMLSNGINFIDIPYVAHTLDLEDEEDLVINCDEMDCMTFVEYTLALSLCPTEDGQVAEGDFADWVQKIRYRDGKIDGYTSRLHYATDWIDNGLRNGFLEDVTAKYSPYTKKVALSYMSNNPERYRQLAHSPENIAKMAAIEKRLSQQEFNYFPEELLPVKGLPWIKDGDIIAFVTNTPGLDIAHFGIAIYVDGKLGLLHASSSEKKVVISRVAMSQMLKSNYKWTGIRVLRMKK
ncbi:MAG: DUF1460 domain-containing protein [Bacteroides sp.]|nr:DUF1460 domain-containing protein [Bacteroides sp.]